MAASAICFSECDLGQSLPSYAATSGSPKRQSARNPVGVDDLQVEGGLDPEAGSSLDRSADRRVFAETSVLPLLF